MNKIKRVHQIYRPPTQPGFLGKGHVARPVIQVDFSESDPFIMLMDDILEKKDDTPAGNKLISFNSPYNALIESAMTAVSPVLKLMVKYSTR